MVNPLATVLSLYSLFPEVFLISPTNPFMSHVTHILGCSSQLDLTHSWVRCFIPIAEFSVFDCSTQVQAFKVVIFLFFLFAKPLGGSFSSNTLKRCLLQLPVTRMPSFIFALLQFLSTLSTLWSTFCCDAGKGFWGYSRIWKHERSFQVQYIMEILPVQGCCVKQFQTTAFSSWSMWGCCAVHNPHSHTWRPLPNGQDPLRLWCIFCLIREEGRRGGRGRIAVLL